ncbi:hypothetical protein K0M31_010328 [Melipona bicolor]|uniref:Uncharacterized protein n=1 Tax=Melipona bicolor TaxID=60889 RepID=A0AA40FMS2_9HYME|nr:hypothetical protein K0M31_010328 [Melipona bicolor]
MIRESGTKSWINTRRLIIKVAVIKHGNPSLVRSLARQESGERCFIFAATALAEDALVRIKKEEVGGRWFPARREWRVVFRVKIGSGRGKKEKKLGVKEARRAKEVSVTVAKRNAPSAAARYYIIGKKNLAAESGSIVTVIASRTFYSV